jgi:hypothetical protein
MAGRFDQPSRVLHGGNRSSRAHPSRAVPFRGKEKPQLREPRRLPGHMKGGQVRRPRAWPPRSALDVLEAARLAVLRSAASRRCCRALPSPALSGISVRCRRFRDSATDLRRPARRAERR